ncbi:unnamed protein product [Symbiodinium sp. KB8]|nr:unnamed protein product [Symbiodinium sp. KB8]
MEHAEVPAAILKKKQVWASCSPATSPASASQRSGKRVSFQSVPDVHFIELVREKAPKVVLTLEDKDDDTDVEIMGFSAEANATKQIAQLTAQAPELGFVNSVAV